MTTSHRLHARCILLAALALFTATGCGSATSRLGAALVSAELLPPDGGPARGQLSALLTLFARTANLEVTDLVPQTLYEVTADGVPIAEFATDAGGHAYLELPIDEIGLDPRDFGFAVRTPGGSDVLVMGTPTLAEYAPLASLTGNGSAVATTNLFGTGAQRFAVKLVGVEPDDYALWIDGTLRATIDASSGGGSADFSSEPEAGELLLDFDPRFATIEILRGDEYVFAGSGRAEILGLDICFAARREQALIATSGGAAVASLATRTSCSRTFEVRISSVPMGDYELHVGGVLRGNFSVGEDENGATESRLRFSSSASEGGQVLDFQPLGAAIEVRQDGEVWFAIDAFEP